MKCISYTEIFFRIYTWLGRAFYGRSHRRGGIVQLILGIIAKMVHSFTSESVQGNDDNNNSNIVTLMRIQYKNLQAAIPTTKSPNNLNQSASFKLFQTGLISQLFLHIFECWDMVYTEHYMVNLISVHEDFSILACIWESRQNRGSRLDPTEGSLLLTEWSRAHSHCSEPPGAWTGHEWGPRRQTGSDNERLELVAETESKKLFTHKRKKLNEKLLKKLFNTFVSKMFDLSETQKTRKRSVKDI